LTLAAAMLLGAGAAGLAAEAPELFAPRLPGLGDHHHSVTTDVPLAQEFFDQGLMLALGFNHAEAERSFRQAAALDPGCAMCWWGVALVLGPNINAAMSEEAVFPAWQALRRALALRDGASERERAYLDALAKRYRPEPVADRAPLDEAYAAAMGEVARRYPDDLDAAVLYAEALMDTTPWSYWREDGEPKAVTTKILAALDGVLARDPAHAGANHLYIHAVEAGRPERGVGAAERLEGRVPGAGHLEHMPSHIYIRVGRYHDAVTANQRAVRADRAYVTQCHAQGVYPLAYVPHNHHFLWAAASLAGESDVAIDAAYQVAAHTAVDKLREPGLGTLQHYWATPLYGLVRFGRWEAILEEPEPAADLLYPQGVWHYARGMAFARTGRREEAAAELAEVTRIAADEALESVTIWDLNTTRALMEIAREVLGGELAAARGDGEEAIRRLERGVALEDALNYDEPPPWHLPVRQVLGAVLLEAGRPGPAELVYRQDLARFPENGWSLFGLARSLDVQGKAEEAAEARARFERAWRWADVELTGSRM
jgi:tetratricopeptide (TPR) repeat protein